MDVTVGAVLVAGAVVFLVGAGGWRPVYDTGFVESLPHVHRDRSRWRWIHGWMIAAMMITPAGLAGLAFVFAPPSARAVVVMASVVYAIGAVCWIAALTFRLTVVPWAAEVNERSGAPPKAAPPLNRWSVALYAVHMCSAYLASAVLAAGLLLDGSLPRWLGVAGMAFGVLFTVGFATPRVAFAFQPPFWAHVYTGAVGVALLLG